MPPFRALRLAIISFCILTAMIFGLLSVESESLPATLREWSDSQSLSLLPTIALILALLGVVIGCAALLAQKKWGAWMHLASTSIGTAAVAFMGPQVSSAATATIDSLVLILSGFIYGLAFFTDALASHKQTPNQSLQPTALLGRGSSRTFGKE